MANMWASELKGIARFVKALNVAAGELTDRGMAFCPPEPIQVTDYDGIALGEVDWEDEQFVFYAYDGRSD